LRLGYSLALIGAGCLGSARLLAEPLSLAAPDARHDDAAIDAALRAQAKRAHTHRYAWTGINGALTVGSFALIPLVRRESRPDLVVAGVGSALGTVATFVFPLRVESAPAELDSLALLPAAERQQKLRELLRADAEDERARLAWPWHVLNLSVSALAGGIVAFGLHHTESGVTQAITSVVLGEAQLFSQPTGLNAPELSSAKLYLRPQISIQRSGGTVLLIGNW
jgi:hypothetical protein